MHLFLIGMMASGKTTVGKNLASKLGYDFIDTDNLIEQIYHKSINEVINVFGIEHFRQTEYDVLHSLKLNDDTVISTGGGIILNDKNTVYMKNNGVVIYLDTDINILKNRMDNKEYHKRPVLKTHDLSDIYNERKSYYQNACDFSILCDSLNVDEISNLIIRKLKTIDL